MKKGLKLSYSGQALHSRAALQHLPDEEGIETRRSSEHPRVEVEALQHLPDEEGIETGCGAILLAVNRDDIAAPP